MNQPAWEQDLPVWRQLSALQGTVQADVCVIGLGGSGLAAIHRLLELGLNTVGVDAGTVAGAAAGRNGGLLLAGLEAAHHRAAGALGAEVARDWYLASQQELKRMHKQTPSHVRITGSLRIAADEAELADCQEQYRLMRAHGLPVELYEGAEGRGLLFPHDGVCNPLARNRELAAQALSAGARLFENSRVSGLEPGSVRTASAEVRAAAAIVAVDGQLAELLPELAGDVRPLRLQMLGTEPTAQLTVPRPVYYRWGFEYWQQLADGRILLGGFRDHGGDPEWDAEPEPSETVQDRLSRFLREHLGVSAAVTHRWAANVGYRNGILPYFGQVRPGVWALGGYNGTGNVIGSLLGRRSAEQVSAAG